MAGLTSLEEIGGQSFEGKKGKWQERVSVALLSSASRRDRVAVARVSDGPED